MESLANAVWRYFTAADFTLYEPGDADRIRASWPTWRKAVRPIAAAAWWAGIISQWFVPGVDENKSPLAYHGVYALGLVIIASSVIYGTIDGHRTRKRLRSVGAGA
jgi:hypothetical protein